MKKISIAILILLNISNSQSTSSLEAWENILQTPELVEYFKGIFNSLGVIVEETNEKFTINHTGNSFEFEMGIFEKLIVRCLVINPALPLLSPTTQTTFLSHFFVLVSNS